MWDVHPSRAARAIARQAGHCTGRYSAASLALCRSQINPLSISKWYPKLGFPGGPEEKNLPANGGDADSIPESGRSPGGGHGNPLDYSCLENPMDRVASQVHTVHRVTTSQTRLKQLSMHSWSPNYSRGLLTLCDTFTFLHNIFRDIRNFIIQI